MSLDRSSASQAKQGTAQTTDVDSGMVVPTISPRSNTADILRLQRELLIGHINHQTPKNLPVKAKPLSRFRYAKPNKQSGLGILFDELSARGLLNPIELLKQSAVMQAADEKLSILDTLNLSSVRHDNVKSIVEDLSPENIAKLKVIWKIFADPIDLADLVASTRLQKLLGIKTESAHWCIPVVKAGQKNPDKFYFFKINDAMPSSEFSPMSELEAVCWSHYRLYLDDLVPHDVAAIYDDNAGYRFIGVVSENIPQFKPFRSEPITENDLNLGLFPFELVDIDKTFSDLMSSLNALVKHLEDSNAPSKQSTSLSSIYRFTANLANYYTPSITGEYTSAWFRDDLIKLITKKKADAREFLDELSGYLLKRLAHIFPGCLDEKQKQSLQATAPSRDLLQSSIIAIDNDLLKDRHLKKTEWETERTLLRSILQLTQRYREECLANKQKLEQGAELVQQLVKLDHALRAKHIVLEELDPQLNVATLTEHDCPPVSAQQLQKFRRIAGQGASLIAFLYGADHDRHPFNLSGDGTHIDFDLSKIPILIKYKKAGLFEKWNITPNKTDFSLTEIDIVKFPALVNAKPRCHPARQNLFVSTAIQYTDAETSNYKKLANNPIFDFFKYKTLLKIMLTTPAMHEALTRLHIRQEDGIAQKSSEDLSKQLFREIVDYDTDRLRELRSIMTSMHEKGYDQFQEFLKHHGTFALNMILEEFRLYRDHLIASKKDYYDSLIKEIDLEKIKAEFTHILNETKCNEVLIEPAQEIHPDNIDVSFVAMSVYAPSPTQGRNNPNV